MPGAKPLKPNAIDVIEAALSKIALAKPEVKSALSELRTRLSASSASTQGPTPLTRRQREKFLARFEVGSDIEIQGWDSLCEFLDMTEPYIRSQFSIGKQLFQRRLFDGRVALIIRKEAFDEHEMPDKPDPLIHTSGAIRGRRPLVRSEIDSNEHIHRGYVRSPSSGYKHPIDPAVAKKWGIKV